MHFSRKNRYSKKRHLKKLAKKSKDQLQRNLKKTCEKTHNKSLKEPTRLQEKLHFDLINSTISNNRKCHQKTESVKALFENLPKFHREARKKCKKDFCRHPLKVPFITARKSLGKPPKIYNMTKY